MGKIRLNAQSKKELKSVYKEKFNIELPRDETIRNLYRSNLEQKIRDDKDLKADDVESNWKRIKKQIREAAKEALGTRTIKVLGTRTQTKLTHHSSRWKSDREEAHISNT